MTAPDRAGPDAVSKRETDPNSSAESNTSVPDAYSPHSTLQHRKVYGNIGGELGNTVNGSPVQNEAQGNSVHDNLTTAYPHSFQGSAASTNSVSQRAGGSGDGTPPVISTTSRSANAVDRALHTTSPHHDSHRVRKPQQPPRIHPLDSSTRFYDRIRAIFTDLESETQGHHDRMASLEHVIAAQDMTIKTLKESEEKFRAQCARHTDVVKKMQKYVSGMESDQQKLKLAAQNHQSTCSSIVEEKTRDFKQEEDVLRRDFNETLDVMQKSHRSMKKALDECQLALVASESKQKALAASLTANYTLLKKEQSRCNDLERQVLPSIQALQRYLTDETAPLFRRLSIVETSVDNKISKRIPDGILQECFDLVKALKDSPILTVGDVTRAEGMLRYVHERFELPSPQMCHTY